MQQPVPECQEVLDLLYLYSSDECTPEEQELIERHIQVCDGCRKALEEHGILRRSLPSGFQGRKLYYYSRDN